MRAVRPKEERVLQDGTDYSSQGPVGAEFACIAQSLALRYVVISLSHRGHGAIMVETDGVRLALLFTTSSNVGDG